MGTGGRPNGVRNSTATPAGRALSGAGVLWVWHESSAKAMVKASATRFQTCMRGYEAIVSNRFRAREELAPPNRSGYCRSMVDLKLQVPATDKVEVDAETLAAIDRGIKDADEGRTVPIDEVRKMIPKWISKFESQKPR